MSRFMEKHVWGTGFLDKFMDWFDRGYFRDILPLPTSTPTGVSIPVKPNPIYLFRQVVQSRAASRGHGSYKKIDHYLKEAWKIYAKNGERALSEYIATLPAGVFYRFRNHYVDNGGHMSGSNIYYQFAQYVMRMNHPDVKLNIGDHLHRQRVEDHLQSSMAQRHHFAEYPDLEHEFDKIQAERQKRREERMQAQQVSDLRRPNGSSGQGNVRPPG